MQRSVTPLPAAGYPRGGQTGYSVGMNAADWGRRKMADGDAPSSFGMLIFGLTLEGSAEVVEGGGYHGTGRPSRKKPPVGPESGRGAAQVTLAAPSATGRPPGPMSVATQPGQTALTRTSSFPWRPATRRTAAAMLPAHLRPIPRFPPVTSETMLMSLRVSPCLDHVQLDCLHDM